MVKPVYKTIDGKLIIYDRVPDDFDESLLEGEPLTDSKEKARFDESALRNVETTNNDLFFTLKFRNPPTLRRWQAHAQEALQGMEVDWEIDFHVTLVFVSGISRMDTFELTMGVDVIDAVPIVIEGFGTFSTERGDKSNVLYLAVEKTEELVEVQEKLFDFVKDLGHDTSPFSIPEDWTPHITLGTSEELFDEMLFPDVGGMAISASDVEASVDFQALAISEKFNPYHDEIGRFTSAVGAGIHRLFGKKLNISKDLAEGKGRKEEFGPGQNSSFKYTTENGEKYFLKEIDFINFSSSDREFTQKEVETEILNSEISKIIGTEEHVLQVSNASYIDGETGEEISAVASKWVEGNNWFGNSHEFRDGTLDDLSDAELTRVFLHDQVTFNTDRHPGNLMITEDGFILIDNGKSFSVRDSLFLSQNNIIHNMIDETGHGSRDMDLDVFAQVANSRSEVMRTARDSGALNTNQLEALDSRLEFLGGILSIAEEREFMTFDEFVGVRNEDVRRRFIAEAESQ